MTTKMDPVLKEELLALLYTAAERIEGDYEFRHSQSNIVASWDESTQKRDNAEWQTWFTEMIDKLKETK